MQTLPAGATVKLNSFFKYARLVIHEEKIIFICFKGSLNIDCVQRVTDTAKKKILDLKMEVLSGDGQH